MLSTLLPQSTFAYSDSEAFWEPNLFVRITPDNVVTLMSTQYEIGQGTTTGLAQILADELGADFNSMIIHQAEGNAEKYGLWTGTGGSYGIASNWKPLRTAAAATREMLIEAACTEWGVSKDTCKADNGFVTHSSGKRLSFGSLSAQAAKLKMPENPILKSQKEYKFIGKSLTGPKQQRIVKGTTQYSVDIQLPNMVYASIERVPVYGGKLASFDASEALKTRGVIEVFSIDGNENSRENSFWGGVRPGVVVVADSTWSAIQGRKKLKINWELGSNQNRSGNDIAKALEGLLTANLRKTVNKGNVTELLSNAEQSHTFSYTNGFQVNACMEPLNAVADVKPNKAEIWAGTQAPGLIQVRAANLLGLKPEQVIAHAQPSGGGFGRRFFTDYVEEAVLVSQKMQRPVKTMWTREDDINANRYHDQFHQNWTGMLDNNRQIVAVDYKGHVGTPSPYTALSYSFPNLAMSPIGVRPINNFVSWRSVRAHQWVLGLECFMDEMAHQAKMDPLQFRLNHLVDEDIVKQTSEYTSEDLYPARMKECLKLAASKAGWGKKQNLGIAGASYNASYCAVVAEVSSRGTGIKIDRLTAAVDCGLVINPSQVKAQIEGGIIWGLSAVISEITIENGVTQQTNFHDYKIPRMSQVPPIEVHIVESNYTPTGVGEPSVIVAAPAILNAIFSATRKRLRHIPIDLEKI